MSVQHAKLAGTKWKESVFGFMRRYSVLECISIAPLVHYLCLDYYYLDEKFTIDDGCVLTMSDNDHFVTNHSANNDHELSPVLYKVEGNIAIHADPEGISEYKWTFGISIADFEFSKMHSISCIGIYTGNNDAKFITFKEGKVVSCSYTNGAPYFSNVMSFELQDEDILTMKLHVTERKLYFKIFRCGVVILNQCMTEVRVDEGCRFRGLIGKGLSIKLIDFSIKQK